MVEGAESDDDKVKRTLADLAENCPQEFDKFTVQEQLLGRADPEPLKEVLSQEVDRYNALIRVIRKTVVNLDLGIDGLVSITSELENVYDSLLTGRVPTTWNQCFPSLKPLGSWTGNLWKRLQQIRDWIMVGMPTCFWMEGITFPTAFLTAVLQASARKNAVSIDGLGWDFSVMSNKPTAQPKEGFYCEGAFAEGFDWSREGGHLVDAEPMKLISNMPAIHFKPKEGKVRFQC